ncbi:hypothetical protein GCM10010965_17600 [Caldalkalibacillus thermarum]|uniref:helix-turn-helix domain-containing protein n=1 Tax=Caldalkalibacillus thermarum TaxID=296745 RepID=UPI001665C59C|nr:tetratricopeptide repeat protein [Caldalkalibacillus thermarum]GGK25350.1 hypothetical protein GCM10010965_17600 [Caldalkalibacillus thermarum]
MHIGKRIAKLRREQQLSLVDLADGHLSKSELFQIEAGHRLPKPAVLEYLAQKLDIPADHLLRYDRENPFLMKQLRQIHAELDKGCVQKAELLLKEIGETYPYISSVEQELYYLLLKNYLYIYLKEFSQAVKFFDEQIVPLVDDTIVIQRLSSTSAINLYYYVQARVFQYKHRYLESNRFFCKLLTQPLDEHQQAHVFYNMARNYYFLNEFEQAKTYGHDALPLSLKHHMWPLVTQTYILIGMIGRRLKDYETAEEFYKWVLKLTELHEMVEFQTCVLDNLGNLYLDQGKYRESLAYFQKDLYLSKHINSPQLIISYCNVLEIYLALSELEEYHVLMDEAKQVCEHEEDWYRLLIIEAKRFYKSGDVKNYETLMEKCINYFSRKNMLFFILEEIKHLACHLAKQKNHAKARHYFNLLREDDAKFLQKDNMYLEPRSR